jgi:predicted DsbA family dithiol-disulfide isomerase
MNKMITKHRVITFLNRQELEFLDKLQKDMMFSTGRRISRSAILQDLAELLAKTQMDAVDIKDDAQLEEKMMRAIARLSQAGQEGAAR